jgi:hypothetical protein
MTYFEAQNAESKRTGSRRIRTYPQAVDFSASKLTLMFGVFIFYAKNKTLAALFEYFQSSLNFHKTDSDFLSQSLLQKI